MTSPIKVLLLGHPDTVYAMVSNFAGDAKEIESGNRLQTVTKGDTMLMRLQRPHGRMPIHRLRRHAIHESQAYVIVVPNADASYNFEYLLKEIDEVVPINRGPVLLLLEYMIDEKPSANKVITEWAKEKNVPIEFLNIHRIKKNDADESKILSSIITGLVEKVKSPKEEETKEEKEKEKEIGEVKEKKEVIPQGGILSKAISYLTSGGSVA